MIYTLGQMAEIIKAELIGDPGEVVARAEAFESARKGDLTFASDARFLARVKDSQATAVIVSRRVNDAVCNLLIASNPKLAFARAIQALHEKPYKATGVSGDLSAGEGTTLGNDLSIHPRVTIGRNTVIGNRVTLHPGVVIGDDCRIGDDTVVFANVAIYDECEIGNRVRIHAGTVIGADGFGFVADEEGRQVKMLQLGRVIVEDDCEIGANCAIDCGGFTDTILRRGVKLDNLIQVGHNCEIGEDTVVAAHTGFSGGTRVGRSCVIAGQVGTREHITIGDGSTIMARAAVTKHVRAGAMVGGIIPAQDYNAWRRSQAIYSRLPDMAKRLKQLERKVGEMARPTAREKER